MIKQTGQFLGLLIGSSLSPSWFLMRQALGEYFSLDNALSGPYGMIAEYNKFNLIVNMYPQDILQGLVPKLILILVLGCTFVSVFSILGGRLAVYLADQYNNAKPTLSS